MALAARGKGPSRGPEDQRVRLSMDRHLNEALTDAVRRWARPTTPDELKQRGVSRLRSVSMTRVASLIEKAVNRTMLARTLGDYPEDAESFSKDAREEFLRLMDQTDSAPPPPVEAEAMNTLGRLKAELAERRREMKAMEAQQRTLGTERGTAGAGDAELERRLRELFVAWGGSPDHPSALEREVIALAVSSLQRERAESERMRLESHRREIDVLERRIAKVTKLLGETEAELLRAVRSSVDDPGLASIYDRVQGIDLGDGQFTKKAQLMAEIYRANLDMRRAMAASR